MSQLALPPLRLPLFTLALARICEALPMIFEYVLGAIATVGLLVYLVIALIRPERF
jgi:K+-transporting ATPase KdpF subunit